MKSRVRQFKKFIAELLCTALIACGIPGIVFAAGKDDIVNDSVTSGYDAKDMVLLTASASDTGGTHHSSGGGGGGGGGSSKSSSSTGSGVINTEVTIVSAKGTWSIDEYGHWRFTDGNGRRYVNEWGYIYDPNSDKSGGLPTGNWYHFGNDGIMDTGWYSGSDRKIYYLDPDPDNRQGVMMTGWVWIDGNWYYFDSNGELLRDAWTPDGYYVDGTGARIGE